MSEKYEFVLSGEFRPVKPSEWFVGEWGCPTQAPICGSLGSRVILTRRPITPAVGVVEAARLVDGLYYEDGYTVRAHDEFKSTILKLRAALADYDAGKVEAVSVPVETLRNICMDCLVGDNTPASAIQTLRIIGSRITALLPPLPKPRPEPSKELVREWTEEAWSYAKTVPHSHASIHPTYVSVYIAARRAAWLAEQEKGARS